MHEKVHRYSMCKKKKEKKNVCVYECLFGVYVCMLLGLTPMFSVDSSADCVLLPSTSFILYFCFSLFSITHSHSLAPSLSRHSHFHTLQEHQIGSFTLAQRVARHMGGVFCNLPGCTTHGRKSRRGGRRRMELELERLYLQRYPPSASEWFRPLPAP